MISRSTLIWLLLAALLGFGVFKLKYEVVAQEERLAALDQAILADQSAIHVLQAEWTFLNQPSRLQDLATRYLQMQPTTAPQIVGWDQIPLRGAPPAAQAAPQAGLPDKHKPRLAEARIAPGEVQ